MGKDWLSILFLLVIVFAVCWNFSAFFVHSMCMDIWENTQFYTAESCEFDMRDYCFIGVFALLLTAMIFVVIKKIYCLVYFEGVLFGGLK